MEEEDLLGAGIMNNPELVAINFATFEQLKSIPGIGEKVANTIVSVRDSSGNINEQILTMLTRGKLSKETMDSIDFTSNKTFAPSLTVESTKTTSPIPHPPGPLDMAKDKLSSTIFDPVKNIFSPKPIPVKSEPVQTPSNLDLASLTKDWEKMLEVVKMAQTLVGSGKANTVSPYGDDDLESLPAVPKHPPRAMLSDSNLTPMTSMQTPKTKLNFSSSEKSYDTDTDSESYQSAMSVVERPKRKQKISEKRKRSSDVIRHFPKGLYFDGKSNWETFKEKFKKCALVLEWTPDECLTGLCWSLTDKAADFYAVITDRDKLSYQQLMKKLENRFGARELPATAQARFQQATQNTGESLEDWADRIVTLATRAFRELPESYANQQAVVRFCQGLLNKEVASQVSIKEPASMEDAINKVRWGQHVQQAVFGKKKERNRKSDSDDDDLYMVSEIVSTKQSAANVQRSGNAYPSEGSMEQLIENLRQELNKKFESIKSTITSSSFQGRGRGRRYAPADLECFVCGELGHYARDCGKKVGGNKSGQTNKQQLNN